MDRRDVERVLVCLGWVASINDADRSDGHDRSVREGLTAAGFPRIRPKFQFLEDDPFGEKESLGIQVTEPYFGIIVRGDPAALPNDGEAHVMAQCRVVSNLAGGAISFTSGLREESSDASKLGSNIRIVPVFGGRSHRIPDCAADEAPIDLV